MSALNTDLNGIPVIEEPLQNIGNSDPLTESKIEASTNAALNALSALSIKANSPRPSPLHDFVNLTNPEVLKTYLAPNLQGQVQVCAYIASRIYETPHRGFDDNKYGAAFPMDSEILAYCMQRAKDEIVVELAGAHGENSILLAAAGAKKVYMNDIQPNEIRTFRELCENLPSEISSRLTPIEGNCLEILEKKPKLAHKVGLILCRNLLHFFPNEDQERLLRTIKDMLKPGGRAIFTVNSNYSSPAEDKRVYEENPDATCFTTTHCLVSDYRYGGMPRDVIFKQSTLGPEDFQPFAFTALYLYEKGAKTNGKWQVDNDAFMKIDAKIRPLIKQAVEKNKEMLKAIPAGAVRVLLSTVRSYSMQNLSALFRNHGFEIEDVFVVARDGHLVQPQDISSRGHQVGVIVSYQPG